MSENLAFTSRGECMMDRGQQIKIGFHVIMATAMVGILAGGCSNSPSVGVRVGEPGRPPHPVISGKPGPPPHAPAHGFRKKFAYQYYPAVNVYYDPARGVYFFLAGSQWQMGASLPPSITLHAHEAVSLELTTDRPYLHNAKHLKQVKYKRKGPKHKGRP
jgi:hypothetical protein